MAIQIALPDSLAFFTCKLLSHKLNLMSNVYVSRHPTAPPWLIDFDQFCFSRFVVTVIEGSENCNRS